MDVNEDESERVNKCPYPKCDVPYSSTTDLKQHLCKHHNIQNVSVIISKKDTLEKPTEDENDDNDGDEEEQEAEKAPPIEEEVRKVPPLRVKLSKLTSPPQIRRRSSHRDEPEEPEIV